ncbi:queuine/archaeosine tRNA-ribosyltransferase [Rhizobium laguerreae]|jgi:hypothetical protein
MAVDSGRVVSGGGGRRGRLTTPAPSFEAPAFGLRTSG